MIESLLLFLEQTVIPLGAGGVFLASVAEEVVAPIPSALVMMAAGFLFVSGPVDTSNILRLVFFVGLPAAAGVTIGSLWIYAVAYWGGKPSLDKFGKWLGFSWADVEKMQAKFAESKKEEVAIMGARILPVVPSVAISAFCGFIRMKFWKYCALTFFGMFLRGLLMGAVGWQAGNVYHKYANVVSKFENIGLIIIFAVFTIFICSLYLKRKKQ